MLVYYSLIYLLITSVPVSLASRKDRPKIKDPNTGEITD